MFLCSKVAHIIRRDIFEIHKTEFSGEFELQCQERSVPQSLLSLIGMITAGPNINTKSSDDIENQAALSISQLIRYNSTIRRRRSTGVIFHSKDREPPLPVYLGLLLHARKKGLVDKLCDLGLSISYNRVLQISTEMGNNVCAQFQADEVVCPPILRKTLFTTSAVDNIDHNPSSTTAKGSLLVSTEI